MELVRVGLIPSLSSTRVDPAEPIRYSLSLFNFITILGIVLVDVKREKRRIDGRICIQGVDIDPASSSFMMLKMWRNLGWNLEQGIKISFLL